MTTAQPHAQTTIRSALESDLPLLTVTDLAVSFDNGPGPRIQAVDGVRLSVYPRQTLAIVGESGCGKSVTAMSMMHLIPRPAARFDHGTAVFSTGSSPGRDLLTLSSREIRAIRGNEIAMIFQEPMTSLNPVYSVGSQIVEAIVLHQSVRASVAKELAIQAMRDVGIPDPDVRFSQYPHQFSGGMRQRVMIAMALACKPKLLLADEPTTALDVTVQAQILELLRDLQASHGMAIMLITHDLGVVAENADVVCVMYAGRVVEYAAVGELFKRPLHPYTRGLLASIPKVGEVRDRLVTISEVIDREENFHDSGEFGGRPWWPWHTPPGDLAAKEGFAGDYVLHEVRPDHWVGLWRTAALTAMPNRFPDVNARTMR